jgi:hypothetical protein
MKKLVLIAVLAAILIPDSQALATPLGSAGGIGLPALSFTKIVQIIVQLLEFVSGLLGVFFLVLGGIKYIVSNSDSARINNAKKTIQYAITGLIVAAMAQIFISFVLNRAP